ncbi:hypothetical protein [Desulfosporosinus shakirovi]|uniref:hypothetical protein n=1 Tax=Desulfosporosinus shakirovi TaxID=2885154 RepID=UPI001E4AB174|nr:hypothetical protein [Desulfosporosinus sp. SRJS8]MCB8817562.1 hypothetical protein [Desulfosporosinus sp. SRJS8]
MLTMAQVQNIKFLRDHKGLSLRSVAKETGHYYKTVKKYVEKTILTSSYEKSNTER